MATVPIIVRITFKNVPYHPHTFPAVTWESGQNALRNPLHSAKILLRIIADIKSGY